MQRKKKTTHESVTQKLKRLSIDAIQKALKSRGKFAMDTWDEELRLRELEYQKNLETFLKYLEEIDADTSSNEEFNQLVVLLDYIKLYHKDKFYIDIKNDYQVSEIKLISKLSILWKQIADLKIIEPRMPAEKIEPKKGTEKIKKRAEKLESKSDKQPNSKEAKPEGLYFSKGTQEYNTIYYSWIYNLRLDENVREALKKGKEQIKNELINKLKNNQRLRKAEQIQTKDILSDITNSLNQFYDKKLEEVDKAWKAEMAKEKVNLDEDDQIIFFWNQDKERFKKELFNLVNWFNSHNYVFEKFNYDLKNYKEKEVDNVFHSREVTSERLINILNDSNLKKSQKISILRTEYEVLNTTSPNGFLTRYLRGYLNTQPNGLLTTSSRDYLNTQQKLNQSQSERQQPHIKYARALLDNIDECERSFSYKVAKISNTLFRGHRYDPILQQVGQIAHQLILYTDKMSKELQDDIKELIAIKDFDNNLYDLNKLLHKIKTNINKDKKDQEKGKEKSRRSSTLTESFGTLSTGSSSLFSHSTEKEIQTGNKKGTHYKNKMNSH